MSQKDAVHGNDDLEKSWEDLIHLIRSSKADKFLRGAQGKLQEFFDHHIKTKKKTTDILNGVISVSFTTNWSVCLKAL